MLDTSPSLTPNTAARADAALDVAVVVLGTSERAVASAPVAGIDAPRRHGTPVDR